MPAHLQLASSGSSAHGGTIGGLSLEMVCVRSHYFVTVAMSRATRRSCTHRTSAEEVQAVTHRPIGRTEVFMNRVIVLTMLIGSISWRAAAAPQSPAGTERERTTTAQEASPGKSATLHGAPDVTFAAAAAQANLGEVALGHLANERGEHADVRQFGERMVSDHTTAYNRLKDAASGLKVTLPDDPGATQNAQKQKLSALHGTAFDKAYARLMVEDHKKAIALFQNEAQEGTHDDLTQYAEKTLPILQEHQRMAERLMHVVGQ